MLRKLLLAFALSVAAAASAAENTPEEIARAFYDAYGAGDVAKAATFWDAAEAPLFTRRAERFFQVRCVTHHRVIVAAAKIENDRATVDAEAFVTVAATNGFARNEKRFSTFTLTFSDRWRITQWNDREYALALSIGAMPSSARAAAIDAAGELRSIRLVQSLIRVATSYASRNDATTPGELIALARAFAEDLRDDAALSLAMSAESYWNRYRENQRHRAIAIATEAVAIAERAGDPEVLARALVRLGEAQYMIDRRSSRPAFERVMAMQDEIEDTAMLGQAASYIGYAATADLDPATELRYGLLALRYGEMAANQGILFNAHGAVAEAYEALGYFDLAIAHYEKALDNAMRRSGGNRSADTIAQAAYHLAPLYEFKGRTADARRAVERAIAYAGPSTRGAALLYRINRALVNQDWSAAERDLEEAAHCNLVMRGSIDAPVLLSFSKLRWAQGRQEEALELAESALHHHGGMYGEEGDFHLTVEVMSLLRRMKRFDEARALVPMLEQQARLVPSRGFDQMTWHSFFGKRSNWHAELVALAVDTGDAREALRLASEAKGHTLRAFANRESPAGAMTDEERALATQLAQLNRDLVNPEVRGARAIAAQREAERVRNEIDALRARIAAEREVIVPTPTATGNDLELATDRAVIQFVQTPYEVVVIGLGAGPANARRVIAKRIDVTNADLARKVDALRALIESRDLRYARTSRELFDLLLGPVRELIEPQHALLVIPDGVLWQIPFHALRMPDGRYVAEVTSTSYAPTLALADLAATSPRASRPAASLIAFGNPELHARATAKYRSAFTGAELGRLPDAEQEVREVARMYGPRSRVYVGDAATEAKVKSEAANARILHIATHGAADRASPLASAMLLAPGASHEDGVLEAREVLGLQLHSDLAVLSACNSGSGASLVGEGIVGLSWAFLAAGCPTTVVSQWNATSTVTSRLMIAFHRHLREGDAAAVALRKAQSEIRRDKRHSHPYYWAPFVVVGAQ